MKTLYIAKILTLASPLYAEAMLVEGGRIIAVGDKESILASHADIERTVECDGIILPSFIDAHGHFNSMSAAAMYCSVRGVGSIEEIGRRVGEHIKSRGIGVGEWVVVQDYNEQLLPHGKHPTLAELDVISPDRPMKIAHASGHSALYNSLALKIAGITDDTPSPAGGEICRTDGHINGYMLESASGLVGKYIPPLSREDMRGGMKRTQYEYASYGITTVQDGYLTRANLEDYLALEASGELKLDLIGYIPVRAYTRLHQEYKDKVGGHVKIGGIKTFADGSPQLRTAWVSEPYIDGSYGIPNRSDEAMLEGVRLAAEQGAQMLCHANGDAAIEQFLRAVEKAEREYADFHLTRPTVIHGQLMRADQLKLARKVGAVISFFVAHTYHWADVHARNLGIERAQMISPVRTALGEGVHVSFHQDPPVILPDMLETVWCAVNRITREGKRLVGEEISVLEALRAITIGAAYQYHEENIKGTLEAGKYADFVILDRDPLEIPKEDIRNARILATYKEGECVYKNVE